MFNRAHKRVFDIAIGIHSDLMTVLIIETDHIEKKPIIHYYTHEKIRKYDLSNPEDAYHALKETLLSVTLSLAQNGFKKMRDLGGHIHPQSLFVIAGAPFGATVTRKITLSKDTAFAVTPDFIKHVVEEAEKQNDAKSGEIAVFSESGMHVSSRLLSNALLNGYSVASFTGQKATELHLHEIIEVVSSVVGEILKDAEKNLLPHVPMVEHTFSLAVATFLKALYPHTKSFLAVEFHTQGTECILIQNGVLTEHTSISYGFADAAKHLSESAGTLEGEAETHLHEYGKDTLYEDMQSMVTDEVATHALTLKEMLLSLHTNYVLPNDVFVLSSEPYDGYSTAVVEQATKAMYQDVRFAIHSLSETEIDDRVISQLDVTESLSISALIIALFVHMERNRNAKDTGELAVY